MININLLPESLRKKGGVAPKQLLGLVAAVAVLGGLVYMVTKYQMDTLPTLRDRKQSLQTQQAGLRKKVEELKKINQEIASKSAYVDAVKGLYRQRVVWSKVLSDVKNIVNFDPSMSEYNTDMRYLWLTKLNGRERSLSMQGFATASSQVVAMQLPERLLHSIRSYAPVNLPEKDEEIRLQDELRKAVAEHEAERRERPELPMQGPRELSIRQRLEEIKTIKSGGIALMPFHTMLVGGSLKLNRAAWVKAPTPRGYATQDAGQLFPEMAWSFNIEMTLK